jgi:RNA polymerase sigma factor (sigma-70 family)
MKDGQDITQAAFDKFLAWLDPDRERAAKKYEEIRRRLIKIFTCRGCFESEDLADQTINRVIRKAQDITESYVGDPALYFYGVARNVHLEYVRKSQATLAIPQTTPDQDKEIESHCLEACMERLPAEQREWVLEYYKDERRAKIDHRKEMAERLGIASNALRIRMHRIRLSLQNCVVTCMQQA